MITISETNIIKKNDCRYDMVHISGTKMGHINICGYKIVCDCYDRLDQSGSESSVYITHISKNDCISYKNNIIPYTIMRQCVRMAEAYCKKYLKDNNNMIRYTDNCGNIITINKNAISSHINNISDTINILQNYGYVEKRELKFSQIYDIDILCNGGDKDCVAKLFNKIGSMYGAIIMIAKDNATKKLLVKNNFVNIDKYIGVIGIDVHLYIGNDDGKYILDSLKIKVEKWGYNHNEW